jgi:[ribosomal protein S18]-alanine N-acetyltransferase
MGLVLCPSALFRSDAGAAAEAAFLARPIVESTYRPIIAVAQSGMDPRSIVLGFARRSDALTLALMSRDLIEAGLGWEYRAERIARLIADPETVALVARDGADVIAFAVMPFGDERAHLTLLAVSPTYQRRGIARRLIAWLLDSATVAGMSSIHVELRAGNTAARRLYRSAGFVETLRLPGYYRGRENALRMIRMLRAPGAIVASWRPPMIDKR